MAHILVIEDERAIAMILKEVLEDEGYEVTTASNGIGGLEKLHSIEGINVVLLDLNMPGMGGREVIEVMRSEDNLKGLPVILITGTVYSKSDFPPAGTYQEVIAKPFEFSELLDKIRKYVGTVNNLSYL